MPGGSLERGYQPPSACNESWACICSYIFMTKAPIHFASFKWILCCVQHRIFQSSSLPKKFLKKLKTLHKIARKHSHIHWKMPSMDFTDFLYGFYMLQRLYSYIFLFNDQTLHSWRAQSCIINGTVTNKEFPKSTSLCCCCGSLTYVWGEAESVKGANHVLDDVMTHRVIHLVMPHHQLSAWEKIRSISTKLTSNSRQKRWKQ